MPDIAPVRGLIELTDNYTSQLGLADAALSNFTKTNQASLKAVAGAAGLVAAALGAVAVATIELGKRGADVNDVNDSLQHFAGGAQQAKDAMDALRAGTKGTVDNFILAKDAAHLLSAGVKLTADDFGILGQASFVLQNRGLGGTKEQLELVSDAMVTGRTRALSMALGVVDAGDAETNYAKTLGITKDQLSDAGKVEAKRIEVMRILKAAVADAGAQERDFGEEFEFASAQITNWIDDLGAGIAKSEVFKAGFKAVEQAVSSAFGNSQSDAIEKVIHFVEQGAIKVLDFAQGAITMARVVEGAWQGVKTIILGVETIIVATADAMAESLVAVAKAGAALHIVSPDTVATLVDTRTQLRAMTADLASQTVEAAKGVLGHTALDDTFDKLSGTLSGVRDAMAAASTATSDNSKASDKGALSAKALAAGQAEINAKMIDQQKITAALIKSSSELAPIWDEYYKAVVKNSGTSKDSQVADIEATFNAQVDKLDALDPLFNAKYKAYRAVADEALKGINSDWDSVKDTSLEGLQQIADKQLKTYDQMLSSGLHFTRDVIDAQRQKWRDAQDAANGWGKTVKTALDDAAGHVQILDHAWVTDADFAAMTINRTTIMVKTLTGELISLAEAQKRQRDGGSYSVSSQNFAETLQSIITSGGMNPSGAGSNVSTTQAYDLAKKGYSFNEILQIFQNMKTSNGPIPPPQGPRIPGFKFGGTADIKVGEDGPEVVRVPLGSTVFPTGSSAGANGGLSVTLNLSGLLLSHSPAGRAEFASFADDALTNALSRMGWRPGTER